MKTIIAPASPENIKQAAYFILQGQLVAMPTETVYGLAANALDEKAVSRIFEAKGRPQDNPLIVHIDDIKMLSEVVQTIPQSALHLASVFWPGPLTLVLPRKEHLAAGVSAGLDTVGVRMPAHPAARQLIAAAGVPLAAPSANLSGSPSPTSVAHVQSDLAGRIAYILDGGTSPVGVESTVLSLAGKPTILRPGFVTPQEIEEVLGEKVYLSASLEAPLVQGAVAESPGMKYRHYAPQAQITILNGGITAFQKYVKALELSDKNVAVLCFTGEENLFSVPAIPYGKQEDAASQAAGLFCALRKLDKLGAQIVFARQPAQDNGIGLAVRNRLLRAAAFREIQL